MGYTVLKFLKCRWLIFQNIADLSTCKKTAKFLEIWTKLQMSKLEDTFSISEVFKYSTFGRMFDWRKMIKYG